MVSQFPTMRLRRLRSSQVMRDLLQENSVSVNDLIYPIFVEEELDEFAPVESMPGIFRTGSGARNRSSLPAGTQTSPHSLRK